MCNMLSECSHSTLIITYSWILHWKIFKRDKSKIVTKLAVKKTGKCSFGGTNVHARRKQTLFKQSCTFGQLKSMEFYALTIKITYCKYLSLLPYEKNVKSTHSEIFQLLKCLGFMQFINSSFKSFLQSKVISQFYTI